MVFDDDYADEITRAFLANRLERNSGGDWLQAGQRWAKAANAGDTINGDGYNDAAPAVTNFCEYART